MSRRYKELSVAQSIALELVWYTCKIFSLLPFWFHYHVVARGVYVLLLYIIKYRVKVVKDNLAHAFPEKSDAEREEILKRSYVVLSEIFVSTIVLTRGCKHVPFLDPAESGTEADRMRREVKGQSWVGLAAHFGPWEYFSLWGNYSGQMTIGTYHPLHSAVFNEFFMRLRSSPNVVNVSWTDTIRFCLTQHAKGVEFSLGLIADQSPPRNVGRWVNFFHRDTIFFDGGEKIALKLKLPAYFVYQRRHGRGLYEYAYDKLYDGVEKVEPFEITQRYINRLEEAIRETPELWLWSHRRWKRKRPAEESNVQ
ncbi:MAG: lysophospholipid acyltransferase family protein [Rikenellaceae bacterium]